MDGCAIRTKEANMSPIEGDAWTHEVIDKVYAGDDAPPKTSDVTTSKLPAAHYITTGAVVPESFDCVVPLEECQVSLDKKQIRIHYLLSQSEHRIYRYPIWGRCPPTAVGFHVFYV